MEQNPYESPREAGRILPASEIISAMGFLLTAVALVWASILIRGHMDSAQLRTPSYPLFDGELDALINLAPSLIALAAFVISLIGVIVRPTPIAVLGLVFTTFCWLCVISLWLSVPPC